MADLALKVVQTQVTVTGVQAKLSLHLESAEERRTPTTARKPGIYYQKN
jgi:hypothetical protein